MPERSNWFVRLASRPVTSAELVQQFEAVWTPAQNAVAHRSLRQDASHLLRKRSREIARRIRADETTTEYDIQQFIHRRWDEEGMSPEPVIIVAVNANTANPHYVPDKGEATPDQTRRFRSDRCRLQVTKEPGAVFTDQTWTGYVGETVPEEYSRIFNIVREARDSAVDFVRKNVPRRQTDSRRGGRRCFPRRDPDAPVTANSSPIGPATRSAKKCTATASTSITSKPAIRAASFPASLSRSSPAFTSKANLASVPKSMSTSAKKISK